MTDAGQTGVDQSVPEIISKNPITSTQPRCRDRHHLLWCRNTWKNGYANRLRGLPYLIVSIPIVSLHCVIHDTMDQIPVPEEKLCKNAFYSVNEMLDTKRQHCSIDPAENRLQFLIDLWRSHPSASATVDALLAEQELFQAYEDDSIRFLRSRCASKRIAKKVASAAAALALLDQS